MKKSFESLCSSRQWHLEFRDSGTEDWSRFWVLDGLEANVSNDAQGMTFSGGPKQDNSSHGVLWTKQRFKGDMRIKFTMTRLDEINRFVNILYFQANGIGTEDAPLDIHRWPEQRNIPYMATYFEKMDLLHMSYAAFDNENDDPDDYIRVRRYPVTPDRSFDEIEVEPTIYNTGLYKTGESYEMEVIKTRSDLALRVNGAGQELYQHWDISGVAPVHDGPFGIRHMHKKVTRYRDVEIYTA
jgi:hypothetical protein